MEENSLSGGQFGPEKIYFDCLALGRWKIQSCNQCGNAIFYPRVHCPSCGQEDWKWTTPSGGGTVYSKTTVSRAFEQGGDYNVSLIDLDEGVRVMGHITNGDPTAVTIGSRVQARVEGSGGEARLVFSLEAQA